MNVFNKAIVAGTQRRHQAHYVEIMKRIRGGDIGELGAGQCYWNMGALWVERAAMNWAHRVVKKWSDMEWQVRNWLFTGWASRDHIVEQHVHNLDVTNWFVGTHPTSALGFGMRARRETGDQYDFFSIDFEFPEGVHIHSMCRQINDTDGGVSEHLVGEKGIAWGLKPSNTQVFAPGCPEQGGDYVQEHINLLYGNMQGEPVNEAEQVATSTATAIMARISAYKGKKVDWNNRFVLSFVQFPFPVSWLQIIH